MKGFGKNIRKYRNLKKLTQEQLGELFGSTKSYISKLESESTNPSLEILSKIAELLDVNVGDLLEDKRTPPKDLKEAGAEWIVLGEELEKSGITPEQVKQWAEIAKSYSKPRKKE